MFQKKCVFLSLKIYFVLVNSAGPDEIPHYAAFHLGLPCLQKYLFMGFQSTKMTGILSGIHSLYNSE